MRDETQSSSVREHILSSAQTIMSGKGFSAVGLNEILKAADVPKGSFYHYFGSKEAFGEALLERYFERYLAAMEEQFSRSDSTGAERLLAYWSHWVETQATDDPQDKCLVVKLAAEVSDLSEAMRRVLLQGTGNICARLTAIIEVGIADGSLSVRERPRDLAAELYQYWLGASLIAKISQGDAPLRAALEVTKARLL
ncbi:TetR/AcrR family transcriptional regulator [Oceanicella sp. SM1341]|uniref:TetR/AcrR family transcriptional regulator n=1 Tax=Oceanicella sp. SM1341 TaxID=1548889 RepID=UPI000E5216CB|nr:TetR/AcrR family transcriptional regulator [Oceanicella sp. SM1341]